MRTLGGGSSRNIVVFSHKSFIPVISGHAVAVYNRLKELTRLGASVRFYSYEGLEQTFEADDISVIHIAFPTSLMALLRRSFVAKLTRLAKSEEASLSIVSLHPRLVLAAERDVLRSHAVVVEHIWGALLPLLLAKLTGKHSLAVDHNAESLLSLRLLRNAKSTTQKFLLLMRLMYTIALEKLTCTLADVIVAVSEQDARWICERLRITRTKIHVVANAVDTGLMKTDAQLRKATRARLGVGENEFLVCFLGDLETAPNRLAVRRLTEEIAPQSLATASGVRFIVVGRYKDLCPVQQSHEGVIFTNAVPDIRPYLSAADACIAPLEIGGGTKLKLLTYFSFSKPVIATEIAAEGIPITNGTHALFSELSDFPSKIEYLMKDPRLCSRLGVAARELVVRRYDAKVVGAQMAEILGL